jgi:hypothetical protein
MTSYSEVIKALDYNWFYSHSLGEEYLTAEVGVNGVTEIKQHSPQGEGDRLWYDIILEGGRVTRVLNPNLVRIELQEDEIDF